MTEHERTPEFTTRRWIAVCVLDDGKIANHIGKIANRIAWETDNEGQAHDQAQKVLRERRKPKSDEDDTI